MNFEHVDVGFKAGHQGNTKDSRGPEASESLLGCQQSPNLGGQSISGKPSFH